MIAAGTDAFAPERKTAILIHCLREEEQRTYETQPPAVKQEESDSAFDLAVRQLD